MDIRMELNVWVGFIDSSVLINEFLLGFTIVDTPWNPWREMCKTAGMTGVFNSFERFSTK